MDLTDRLYAAAKDIWDGYLEQPFVKELGEGTLREDQFRFYMVQDYRYLMQYAKVFAMGVVKARAEDERLMVCFARMVHDTLDGELNIHKTYMARLGIPEQEIVETKSSLVNQSYTSYMLDAAYRGGPLEILTAVLSCAWSYQMIGEHHEKIPGALEHPLYGEWVAGYSSKEYRESTQEIIDLVNELGRGISPEREKELVEIFVNCSRYEKDFWDMAYDMAE